MAQPIITYHKRTTGSHRVDEVVITAVWTCCLSLLGVLATYILLAFAGELVPLLFRACDDPLLGRLLGVYYSEVVFYFLLWTPPAYLLCILAAFCVVRPRLRARAQRRAGGAEGGSPAPRPGSAGVVATAVLLIPCLLIQCGVNVLVGQLRDSGDKMERYRQDITLYRQILEGSAMPKVYIGPLEKTWRGRLPGPDGERLELPGFSYLSPGEDEATFQVAEGGLLWDELYATSYTVSYLPASRTVLRIDNEYGVPVTGLKGVDYQPPEGHWMFGDLPVRTCGHIYGYDRLGEAERMAFDLFYGEYFGRQVEQQGGGTCSFTLPQPLSREEYLRVQGLYQSNTTYYCYPNYRYDTDSRSSIQRVYAGGIIYGGEPMKHEYGRLFREAADQVVAAMPQGLSDYDKCLYFAHYLIEQVRYEGATSGGVPKTTLDSDEDKITVRSSSPVYATGYGALVNGRANCVGYTQAFDYFMRQAGIPTIPVHGTTTGGGHAWNMVEIGGSWYHVDVTWMDLDGRGSGVDYTFFMADTAQIAATHTPEYYYRVQSIPLPEAVSGELSWYALNGRSFATAQEAAAFWAENPPGRGEYSGVRIESQAERNRLIEMIDTGRLGGLHRYVVSEPRGEPSLVRVVQAGFGGLTPAVQPDFSALPFTVAYGGPVPSPVYTADLPDMDSEALNDLSAYITNFMGGYGMPGPLHHSPEAPNAELVALVGLQHTAPVVWSEHPQLADYGDYVLRHAGEGVLAHHVALTIDAMFAGLEGYGAGDAVSPPAQSIFHNGAEHAYTWRYDPLTLCYVTEPDTRSPREAAVFMALEYEVVEGGIVVVVSQLWYTDYPEGSPESEALYPLEGDALMRYIRDQAPRHRVVLAGSLEDDVLRLVSWEALE